MRKADAIQKLRAGHPLIAEYDADEGRLKYVVAGGGIAPKTAHGIITQLKLVSQKDCLFETMEPQSWRLP